MLKHRMLYLLLIIGLVAFSCHKKSTIEDDDIWRIIAYMRQEYKDRKAAGSEFKYGVYP